MNAQYVLSLEAEADLRDIIRYTQRRWGAEQARNYAVKLRGGIERLVAGHGAIKDMDALYPGLRMPRCEHHYVFCLPSSDGPAIIVAIFHERMDLMVRVRDPPE